MRFDKDVDEADRVTVQIQQRRKLGDSLSETQERILSQWTLTAVLTSKRFTVFKHGKIRQLTRVRKAEYKYNKQNQPSFIVYRTEILRLLTHPKNARDQLLFELPCLMGFRTHEVATWKAEYIHYAEGSCEVYDVKKHQLYTIPLNILVARHAEEALNGKAEGYVVENRSRAFKDWSKPLTDGGIWYIWKKYAKLLQLFPSYRDYSPLVGRRFFAAEWYYQQKLSVATLSKIMRHSDIETTLGYVSKILFYEDLKRDYDTFQFKVMEDMAKNKMETVKV